MTLLGAPIYPEGIPNVLNPKLENLKLMTTRLDEIDPHQAFFLLRNCYSMPKFIYFLRTAPCFLEQGILGRYDEIMRMSLVKILNIQMSDRIWNQATLPVSKGGLGVRPAMEIALSGFSSSVYASTKTVQSILPSLNTTNKNLQIAFRKWKEKSNTMTQPEKPNYQSEWDKAMYEQRFEELLYSATSDTEKARLLAVSSPSSSDWIHAIPTAALGLHLDPMTLKVACGLRLGSPICHPHTCICGELVESNAYHGLSCGKQMGRLTRHNEVNRLIQRALVQAKIPARLEPSNLSRTDDKRPDGITTTSWREGKNLIWDFSCSDTLCKSYVKNTAKEPGKAAEIRENVKIKTYENLSDHYHFEPVCAETLGSWGSRGLSLIKMIGNKLKDATGEPRSTFFLFQQISMAIQKGNVECILGTIPTSIGLDEIFDFIYHESDT